MASSTCKLTLKPVSKDDDGVPYWVWIIVAIVGFLVVLTVALAASFIM